MQTSNVYKLVSAFLLLIVGVALLGSVASTTVGVTDRTLVVNESVDVTLAWINETNVDTSIIFNVTNAPSGWRNPDCPLTSVVLRNSTGTTMTTVTDYVFNLATGSFTLENTTLNQDPNTNETFVDYAYCGDGYITVAWARSIQNLVPGFFALAILGISLMLFYSIAKDEGML